MPGRRFANRYHRALVTGLVGLVAAAASLAIETRTGTIDGFFYDLSLAVTSGRPGRGGDPVAVIAIDAGSLAAPELAATPRVFFGPFWAKLVDDLVAAGARAIGFDIVFAYSANRFPGFDGQYDRDFLAALARARGRIVLARAAGAGLAAPFVAAVYDPVADAGKAEPAAIGYAEMLPDGDGVYRRVVAQLATADGETLPSLAAALLARAGGAAIPPGMILAPPHAFEALPAYRMIDVLHCLERDPAALSPVFAGKVVLVGTNLPDEDRKLVSDRFMPPPLAQPGAAGGCSLPRLGASDWGSRTAPGVFLHAAAVAEVLSGNLVRPLPRPARAAAAAAAAIAGAGLGFALGPLLAAVGAVVLGSALFGLAVLALPFGWWLPVAVPMGAGGGAIVVAYVTRFLAEDRRRRRVTRAFGHYLAPSIVDRLADSEAELRLGGEARDVTIMFADLSGFTALSGRVGPEVLTAVTNRFLQLIVAAVEATGGYVDKFIGDAVMAVWGAPLADPDHAAQAARAALAAVAAVTAAKAAADAAGEPGYRVRIGLNSGPAVIGNVGAPGRYNYTAIGESVNIAARLESVPGDYGCAIVVGPATAAALADRFVLCELDWIKLKGKEAPVAVYELVAERDGSGGEALADPAAYAAALALYRAGEFAAAAAAWGALARSGPPAVMAERARELAAAPPPDWDGVFVKRTK